MNKRKLVTIDPSTSTIDGEVRLKPTVRSNFIYNTYVYKIENKFNVDEQGYYESDRIYTLEKDEILELETDTLYKIKRPIEIKIKFLIKPGEIDNLIPLFAPILIKSMQLDETKTETTDFNKISSVMSVVKDIEEILQYISDYDPESGDQLLEDSIIEIYSKFLNLNTEFVRQVSYFLASNKQNMVQI